jgi:pyridoxal phosphate enzyme (YggS family)
MSIEERLESIKKDLPSNVTLVAVSKFHSEDEILKAYHVGQKLFGENLVQELRRKHENLPADIEWHFIGHLQRNKVKYIVPFISLIHSVDTPELLTEINRQGQKYGRQVPVLLQLHLAKEETKFGFSPEECRQFMDEGKWKELKNIRIDGLMTMASNVEDLETVRSEFNLANELFQEYKSQYFAREDHFHIRSWGMSNDYTIAIEEGSTMIRIGSLIFGPRPHQ